MEISVSIEKFVAVSDAQRVEVRLQVAGVIVKMSAEEALVLARRIELAASEALGVSS